MNNLLDYIDSDEGREDTASSTDCFNCGQKSGTLEIPLADGGFVFACDDCAAEQHRVEQTAEELAAVPSCMARTAIIDNATTTGQLVNQLRAHDQSDCAACAALVCDDCGARTADLTYDPIFKIRTCMACTLKQARIDAICARELGRVA